MVLSPFILSHHIRCRKQKHKALFASLNELFLVYHKHFSRAMIFLAIQNFIPSTFLFPRFCSSVDQFISAFFRMKHSESAHFPDIYYIIEGHRVTLCGLFYFTGGKENVRKPKIPDARRGTRNPLVARQPHVAHGRN